MKHNRILRGLVMILWIVLMVLCVILACKPVKAAGQHRRPGTLSEM